MKKLIQVGLPIVVLAMIIQACGGGGGMRSASNPGGASSVTGLAFNDEGGFQVNDYAGQPEAPNMVFIEGGRATLGSSEEDILNRHDNIERTVTVASFFMDMTEIGNIHWLEYMFYVKRDSTEDVYIRTLPDTLVWKSELAFNDPYVDHYLRYPGFRYYPVVGVSWLQAQDYCDWRTKVVNEQLARDNGMEPEDYQGRIPLESGIVVPAFRLPTEAEWEYASMALVGTQYLDENQSHKRIYPWDGHAVRNPYGAEMGQFLANFKRGKGDYAGIAGRLNDGAMITDHIYAYPPNDYGLYNMAGNVSEWVWDVYRPMSFRDVDDLNPIRRDGFLDNEEKYDEANTLVSNDTRVYKGGSWKDPAYFMSPGTRRYLPQDTCLATLGFRCAMISAGRNN